ncbi:acylphosphatase [Salinicoccus albus]|uniref:acylphosphatase n=1 Tax=Salinicoccus albus TaxID=418756 RepID=UPI00036185D7|nr:acylphosphatase [Salinicoccus albus]
MKNTNVELMPHLTKDVVEGINGFKLCSYLIALEGWRRGLSLEWYKDETSKCKMHRAGGSTQGKYFSLTSDEKTHYFFRSRGDKVSNETVRICQNKEKTKKILDDQNVPIPKGEIFDVNDDQIYVYAQDIGFPVVIKPLSGSMGRGVYTNISNFDELKNAIGDFKKRYNYKGIIVEKHYYGKEYRVYVVGDNVIGATNRVPANIQGDGVNTVRDLIEIKNKVRESNPYLKPKPIKVDYEVKLALKNNGLEMNSVLRKGETLSLREISNLSAGGDPLEATSDLSDDVKRIAVNALKVLPSIPHAGVDIIIDPNANEKAVVLEVNPTAEISFHAFPWEGEPKDVPSAIVDYYFPETISAKKSLNYFDYHSLIEPLKTWSTDAVNVSPAPTKDLYFKRYRVTGKIHKVGYMTFIRRQALKNDIQGYIKRTNSNDVEILVANPEEAKLDEFHKICYKGSKKSKVKAVKEIESSIVEQPFKLGFQIISLE